MNFLPTVSRISKKQRFPVVNNPLFNYKKSAFKANKYSEPQWENTVYSQVSAENRRRSLCWDKLESLVFSHGYAL